MKKFSKKLLSLLLTLAMVLSMAPVFGVTASADGEPVACVVATASTTNYTTISEAVSAWEDGTTLKLLDNITLTSAISVQSKFNCALTLDLNGYVLKGDNIGNIIIAANNGSFTIIDSNPEKVHYYQYSPSAAWTYYGDEAPASGNIAESTEAVNAETDYVKVTGGCISGATDNWAFCHTNYGEDFQTFTMTGGNIVGNDYGVYNNGATYISGTAKAVGNGTNSVYHRKSGYILQVGGAAQINPLSLGAESSTQRAVVTVVDPEPTMKIAVKIEDKDYSDNNTYAITSAAGADYSKYFTVASPNNIDTAKYAVANTGSSDSQVVKIGQYAAVLVKQDGTITAHESVQAAVNNADASGDTVKMIKNSQESVTVSSGKSVTLDLNGYALKGTGASNTNIIDINGGTLTLTDNGASGRTNYFTYVEKGKWVYIESPTTAQTESAVALSNIESATLISGSTVIAIPGGVITGGGFHAIRAYLGGTLNFNGGTIVGNTGSWGVGLELNYNEDTQTGDGGSCTIDGGNIIGNSTSNSGEAAANVDNSSTLTLKSGLIAYNSYTGSNGDYNGAIRINHSGTFNMTGGTISHNYSSKTAGGVAVLNSSTATITGGNIVNNSSLGVGAGISVEASAGTVTIGGNANITGNKYADGTDNNLYLPTGKTVTISTETAPVTGEGGMNVAVSMQSGTGAFTANGEYTDTQFFTSDNTDYCAVFVSDHLELATAYAITNGAPEANSSTNHGYITLSDTSAIEDSDITVTVNPAEGYRLTALTYTPADEEPIDILDYGYFVMPGKAVTVNATFTAIPYVCAVGSTTGTKYESVSDAIMSTEAGEAITIVMISDATEDVIIPMGYIITLDLNDHVLSGTGNSCVIRNDGTLTIQDTAASQTTRYFTDNKCVHGKLIASEECADCHSDDSSGGTTPLKDGCFETLESDYDPAGLVEGTDYVKVTGGCITGGIGYKVVLQGLDGEIIYRIGGGIRNFGGLTLNSGNIVGNTADDGGGIINQFFTNDYNVPSFTMNGGTICGNYAQYTGGGVCAYAGGSMTMLGGNITYNNAPYYGGGLFNDSAMFILGGDAFINNNSSSLGANLATTNAFTLGTEGAAPKEGMSVGVTLLAGDYYYRSTAGEFTDACDTDYSAYFTVEDTDYCKQYNTTTKKLVIAIPNADWYYNHTEGDYELSNIDDLTSFAKIVNSGADNFSGKTVKLADSFVNKDKDGKVAALNTPIGVKSNYNAFRGIFDGNGKTVNLAFGTQSAPYTGDSAGLFGYVRYGTVRNVAVSGEIYIVAGDDYSYAGGVVGVNENATVANCSSAVNITASGMYDEVNHIYREVEAGGVVGRNNDDGVITNCYSTGNINATGCCYAGGVLGFGDADTVIRNCYSTGNISGTGCANLGGIAGYVNYGSTIENCYATGNVSGTSLLDYSGVGGIAGVFSPGTNAKNCYYSGSVTASGTGDYNVGVFAGETYQNDDITNCYYLVHDDEDNFKDINVGINAVGDSADEVSSCYALSESQMTGIARAAAEDGWVSLGSYGTVSMVDALNEYAGSDEDCRGWGVMAVGNYPTFTAQDTVYIKAGKVWSDSAQDYLASALPAGITYSEGKYIFNGVSIAANGKTALYFVGDDVIIELQGNNQVGSAADTSGTAQTTYAQDSYYTDKGIYAESNITFTGAGSLTVYDESQGIVSAGNITFDEEFSGTVTINELAAANRGKVEKIRDDDCCISAGGTVSIKNGTFNLKSTNSFGIHATDINISGGTVCAEGLTSGILANNNIEISAGTIMLKGGASYNAIWADNCLTIADSMSITGAGIGDYSESVNSSDYSAVYDKDALSAATKAIRNSVDAQYVTIMSPSYEVELVSDYVSGKAMILVYTDAVTESSCFYYGTAPMVAIDNTATANGAKYTFKPENGITHGVTASAGKYVYAIVVDNSATDKLTVAGVDALVRFTGVAAETVLSFTGTAQYDVNGTGKTDLNDAVAAQSVYNVNPTYFGANIAHYMSALLKADVNRNKVVDTADVTAILGNYTK